MREKLVRTVPLYGIIIQNFFVECLRDEIRDLIAKICHRPELLIDEIKRERRLKESSINFSGVFM